MQGSIPGNVRNVFFSENTTKSFFWQNIGKAFPYENIRFFLILELKSPISGKIRNVLDGEFF